MEAYLLTTFCMPPPFLDPTLRAYVAMTWRKFSCWVFEMQKSRIRSWILHVLKHIKWIHVLKHIKSYIFKEDLVNKVLCLSYNDLPCHLKPCLLGHFPEPEPCTSTLAPSNIVLPYTPLYLHYHLHMKFAV